MPPLDDISPASSARTSPSLFPEEPSQAATVPQEEKRITETLAGIVVPLKDELNDAKMELTELTRRVEAARALIDELKKAVRRCDKIENILTSWFKPGEQAIVHTNSAEFGYVARRLVMNALREKKYEDAYKIVERMSSTPNKPMFPVWTHGDPVQLFFKFGKQCPTCGLYLLGSGESKVDHSKCHHLGLGGLVDISTQENFVKEATDMLHCKEPPRMAHYFVSGAKRQRSSYMQQDAVDDGFLDDVLRLPVCLSDAMNGAAAAAAAAAAAGGGANN